MRRLRAHRVLAWSLSAAALAIPWDSAEARPLTPRPVFEHLDLPADFPPAGSVRVRQDGAGFHWLGTRNGLFRFDGYRMRAVPDGDEHCGAVHDLVVDGEHLWLADRCGVRRFRPALETSLRIDLPRDSGPPPEARRLFVDRARALLWIGSREGLFQLPLGDPSSDLLPLPSRPAELPEALHRLPVNALHFDPDGQGFVGTSEGIYRIDADGSFHHEGFGEPNDHPDHHILETIFRDSAGTLWATTGRGLRRRGTDPVVWQAVPEIPALCEASWAQWTYGIAEDASGSLWIAIGGSLVRFWPESERFECYSRFAVDSMGLGGSVEELFVDRAGMLWISTGKTLDRYTEPLFRSWSYGLGPAVASYPWTTAWSLSPAWDSDGHLWVGSNLGVFELDLEPPRLLHHYMKDAPQLLQEIGRESVGNLPSFTVFALTVGADDSVWAGTSDGLARLRPGRDRFEAVSIGDGAEVGPSPRISALLLDDARQHLWIGTRRGLLRQGLADGEAMRLPLSAGDGRRDDASDSPSDALESDIDYRVLVLQEADDDGALWVGTERQGLLFVSPEQNVLSHPRLAAEPAIADLLRGGNVSALSPPSPSMLWVGFAGGEILQVDLQAGRADRPPWTSEVGSTTVRSLLPVDGDLWITHQLGLSRVSDGRARHFHRHDGLSTPGSFFGLTRRGDRVYATGASLLELELGALEQRADVPPVRFTDLGVFGRRVPPRAVDPESPLPRALHQLDRLELGPSHSVVTLDLAATGAVRPRDIDYFHRLDGVDDRWLENHSAEPFLTFSRLRPGTYRLRVRAARAGEGPEQAAGETQLRLVVRPHWWASGWAKLLYLLLGLGLLAALVVDQRRKLHREQELNRGLRRLDHLKDEFLANTSHELRTPIFAISGLAEHLLTEDSGFSDAVRTKLRLIVTAGRRLSTLLGDVLDFSRLQDQELDLQPRPVDLRAAVDEAVAICLPASDPGDSGTPRTPFGVSVRNEVPPDLPPALADPGRLRQILFHLIGNAVKFTTEGNIEIRADGPVEKRLALFVEDTGPGIAPRDLERIFTPFEQLRGGATREQGGTGLGLALARRLVELHGGELQAESEPERGSTFSFTLPMADEDAEILDPPTTPRTALVVDDDPINLMILDAYLSDGGYRVTTAESGGEALAKTAERSFDLVLLDIMMPGMSGFDVCRTLRGTPGTENTKIVFVSAKSTAEDRRLAAELGADGYLTKPIGKDELLQAVRLG